MSTTSAQETAFLTALNQHLPPGVDWQQGALDYVAKMLTADNAEVLRRFHLIKPFHSVYPIDAPINQQMTEFIRETAHFLNVLALMRLEPEAKFLDVACGSGWLAHFLTKLRIQATGIDISPDMIAMAQERLAIDPVRTVDDDRFNAEFLVHDMESGPLLRSDGGFDVAILESALHHFVNPIQTLRHIAASLNDRGLIVILEAASDGQGDAYQVEVMQKFQTLERPYTRPQLIEILRFAGLAEYQFLYPVNGFFPQTEAVADALRSQVLFAQNWNTVVIGKRAGVLTERLQIAAAQPVLPPPVLPPPVLPPPVALPLSVEPLPAMTVIATPEGEVGIKGEFQLLASTSKRIVKKAMRKLTGH
jgi:SAM-dependent methyltransferase